MKYGRFLYRRCKNLGLSSKHAHILATYFDKQVDAQGYNGAVAFFKRIGDTIVYGLTISGSKPKWVGTAFRYPKKLSWLRSYPDEVQLVIAKVARAIKYQELRPEQVSKSVTAISTPYEGSKWGLDRLTTLMKRGMSAIRKDYPGDLWTSYPQVGRQFRSTMSYSGPTPERLTPPLRESVDHINGTIFADLPGVNFMFLPLAVRQFMDNHERAVPEIVGQIGATQEGGGKLRVYASPFTAYQLALTPLYDVLAVVLDRLQTDCRKLQERGVDWAAARIRSGKTVCSVDLSSATDRFPYEPQRALMLELGVPEVVLSAFDSLVRGKWQVQPHLTGADAFPEYLKWECGQPLGTRPSFPLFALTHNLVCAGICKEKGLDPVDSFRILGDDVVMVPEMYHDYVEAMTAAGVEISWGKTHVSSTFAEFAGYSITPNSVIRPGKWKQVNATNVVEISTWLGKPTFGETSPENIEIQELMLFRLGKLTLGSEDQDKYLKLLRVNSLLNEKDLSYPHIREVPTFRSGFIAECYRQLGNDCSFYPNVEDPAEPFKVLKGLTNYDYWYDTMVSQDWLEYYQPLHYGHILLEENFRVHGTISMDQFAELMYELTRKVDSGLWLPPRSKRSIRERNSGAYLEKLSRLLQIS